MIIIGLEVEVKSGVIGVGNRQWAMGNGLKPLVTLSMSNQLSVKITVSPSKSLLLFLRYPHYTDNHYPELKLIYLVENSC
ncbi:hypothetical protein Cyast_0287 [Cyanobacterium stanieri PCC 7202]|uniref:Uncharacterized protein n=1 Tax=Cyanobacterium stanieri (strain ATCC 29140 / PCC 7202) TaxID=292563 RepID=K9YIG6_CYASC|nr:hypothetical protein Cyast_0287 [Cyanobacterium stanieri PCC 7202]